MIERVVENWLTKINERSLEAPFCQLLAGEGYQVVHLSRHGPYEEGKDVLAIAPDGVPCAFQLKGAVGGKITNRAWEQFSNQVNRLVEIPIRHPSIDPKLPRRVYLVTNGEIDEEVRVEIEGRNADWQNRGHPRLETIVKGQLLDRFKKLHTNLWPTQLTFEKELLELFLANGTDVLPKGKLAAFLLSAIAFSEEQPKTQASRALASSALFTSYALSSYTQASNHVALVEGWTVYVASIAAVVEKFDLEETAWKDNLQIASSAIERSFEDLISELQVRNHFVEGNPLTDFLFYRGRMTWIIGLISTYALWRKFRDPSWIIDDWFQGFVSTHRNSLQLWGEAAIPQFLALYWFLRQVTATTEPDRLLRSLLESILAANYRTRRGLPDPYHSLPHVIEETHGLTDKPTKEKYQGYSYSLKGLVHLLAKQNWRQSLSSNWRRISKMFYAEFKPGTPVDFCLWLTENGRTYNEQPKMTQSWRELKKEAAIYDVSLLPRIFQAHPELLLLFVNVYPHRLTADVVKFLDDQLWNLRKRI